MSITVSEAVRELLAGRARLTRADGAVVDVVPDPPADDATPLEYGEGVMMDAPPFPATGPSYLVTNVGWGQPFLPPLFVIDESDLRPE